MNNYIKKQYAKATKTPCNIYLFDISEGCKFICERAGVRKTLVGKSVFDIMSPDAVEEMLTHMTSYADIPLFVKTTLGEALALSCFVPSCSFGVLIFPTIGNNDFLRIAKSNGYKIHMSRLLTDGKRWRLTKSCAQNEAACAELWQRIQRIFCDISATPHITGDIKPALEDGIYGLSYFLGCPVGIICRHDICCPSDFDFPLFCAFILVCMCVALPQSKRYGAAVTFSNCECGVLVSFSILNKNKISQELPCFMHLKSMAFRKRFMFEYTYSNEIVHMHLCPNTYDCSLLEIKSPDFGISKKFVPPQLPFELL